VFNGAMSRKIKDLSEALKLNIFLKYFNGGRGNGKCVYGVAICIK
jgi:hypothetical protein